MPAGRTIVQKILDAHRIQEEGGRSLMYVDRLIITDTAMTAFNMIRSNGYAMRRPAQALQIMDHFIPSNSRTLAEIADPKIRALVADTEAAGRAYGVEVLGMGDQRRGILHVVSPELGFAQPGITLVASDSHTSTQGALGALAFSIGADLPHILATQCLWLKTPKMLRINLEGVLQPGVTAKDVALALMVGIGSNGAFGHAIEYAGNFIRALSMDGRMTICNMAVELGGLIGIIGPDAITYDYLKGRPYAATAEYWDQALAFWQTLPSDEDAVFDREVTLDVSGLEPMVTWGNSPDNALPISGSIPDPAEEANPEHRALWLKSLEYMDLRPGMRMDGLKIDQVFIGSCNNSRIEDLRLAAGLMRGRKVAVPTLVVPGSGLVKAQAEAEGLAEIFISAGARWGEAGCSMCVSMNGDIVAPGKRCVSTANRNHIGRQGPGSRTHLASPATAVAAAITGHLTDVRKLGDN